MASAGYSGTPLAKKLGLKDGQVAGFAGLPDSLDFLLQERAFGTVELVATWSDLSGTAYDVLHVFTKSAAAVAEAVPALRDRLVANGLLWMSWPKKASKVKTDVTEDVIRDTALLHRMVDVKVCAVDEIWSGLKLVIRKEHRVSHLNA